MKKTKKISIMLLGIIVSLLLLACMQNVPDVTAQLYYYDNNTSEWKLFDDNVFEKKYLYGQKFVYTVTDSDESKYQFEKTTTVPVRDGNVTITRKYKFNKEQWSLSSSLGNQEIFDDTFKEGNNNLYAYYTVQEESSPVKWSWALYDGASIAYYSRKGTKNSDGTYNVSTNINRTYFNGEPIAKKGSNFYEVGENVIHDNYDDYIYDENGKKYRSIVDLDVFNAYGWNFETAERVPETIKAAIKGNTRQVTIPGTLTRHGYKLLGWATSYNSVKPEYPPEASFDLQYKHGYVGEGIESNVTELFAIWGKDTEAGWWVTTDISNNGIHTPVYFERDKSSNVESASEFDDYPYYKEIRIPAKRYYTYAHEYSSVTLLGTPPYHAVIENDFAIGEHQITGHMLNQLRAWNESSENKLYGFEKYELPEPFTVEASKELDPGVDPSATDPKRPSYKRNFVSYGLTKVGNDILLNEVSNSRINGVVNIYSDNRWYPISYVTIPQAMVICNAMTEYYNSMNQSTERLTYAYVIEGGDKDKVRVRTIEEAESLLALTVKKIFASAPISGEFGAAFGFGFGADRTATGFRLPTQREWAFAALANPNSNWQKNFYQEYSYPKLQLFNYFSGNGLSDTTSDYAIYGTSGTIGFKKEGGRTLNNLGANDTGVKGMSGNLSEWVEDLYPWPRTSARVLGGSFKEAEDDLSVNDGMNTEIYRIKFGSKAIDETGIINWDSDEYEDGTGVYSSPLEGRVTTGLRLVRTLK